MIPTYVKHVQRFLQCSTTVSSIHTKLSNNITRTLPKIIPCVRSLETLSLQQTFDETVSPVDACDDSDVFGNMRVSLEREKSKKEKILRQTKVPKVNYFKPRDVKPQKTRRFASKQVDEADKFGKLNDDSPVWYSEDLNEEWGLEEETDNDGRHEYPFEKRFRNAHLYLNEMKRLAKEKRLKEALELIPDMYKNHVFPIVSNYTFLIGACGRAGYTEMAFKLLRQMTDRGFRPTCAVLTGLFNSCAECPFPDYGLENAVKLRAKITEKNWSLNQTSYHAMIKAFGKCGDIGTAFEIVDEMIKEGINVTASTYNFLLMACIADKDAGFTHAIEVWRKMMSKKMQPQLYTFNLLLRAVRDCGIGPEEISSFLLQHWSSYSKGAYGLNAASLKDNSDILKLPNPEFSETKLLNIPENSKSAPEKALFQDDFSERGRTDVALYSSDEAYLNIDNKEIGANILMKRPLGGPKILHLSNIKTSSDRLALVGNASGYLELMQHHGVKPDVKTFTLLLESLPQTIESEKELLDLIARYKLHPDTDFFNILIKRRNVRYDFMAAKNVLLLLNKHNLSPDIVTFGVLALGCRSVKHGNFLLQDMKNFGVTPNVEILGALISSACKMVDFKYLSHLMKIMRVESILPNERILSKIEYMVENAHETIIKKEQGQPVEERFLDEDFNKQFHAFKSYYAEWLQVVKMEIIDHPWDQYKADISLHKNQSI